ncbi:MAG: hypothetical protein AB7T59_17835 [Hyphomonadaceae bacterium]
MRKALIACLIGVAAVAGMLVTNQALAQGQQQQQQKQKQRPPPPPPPRCPDLGVGTTAFVTELPGQPPLADGELAVTWQVRNDGNTPFGARSVDDQMVALEYTTAAGATRLAAVPAITTLNEDGNVYLAHGHNVRGAIRAIVPPEAAGRRLRLRLVYASEGTRAGIPDCNEANNTAPLPHRPAATP